MQTTINFKRTHTAYNKHFARRNLDSPKVTTHESVNFCSQYNKHKNGYVSTRIKLCCQLAPFHRSLILQLTPIRLITMITMVTANQRHFSCQPLVVKLTWYANFRDQIINDDVVTVCSVVEWISSRALMEKAWLTIVRIHLKFIAMRHSLYLCRLWTSMLSVSSSCLEHLETWSQFLYSFNKVKQVHQKQERC